MEWCITQLSSSSIVSYNITSITHDQYNDIYYQTYKNIYIYVQVEEASAVLSKSLQELHKQALAVSSDVNMLQWVVRREKSVYAHLNLLCPVGGSDSDKSDKSSHADKSDMTADTATSAVAAAGGDGIDSEVVVGVQRVQSHFLRARGWVLDSALQGCREAVERTSCRQRLILFIIHVSFTRFMFIFLSYILTLGLHTNIIPTLQIIHHTHHTSHITHHTSHRYVGRVLHAWDRHHGYPPPLRGGI